MKILMISSTFPYPPTKGGTQVRTFNLLKYLGNYHEITLITQRNQEVMEEEIAELQKWVKELIIFPRPSQLPQGIIKKIQRLNQFLLQGTPPNVFSFYSLEIQEWIDLAVSNHKFDVITCEHSVNEIYVRPQWKNQLSTIVNIHSSVYRTCQNQLETKTSENIWRDLIYLPLLRKYEKKFCQKFSQIIVTTEADRKQIQELSANQNISVIPNGVDLNIFPYRSKDPGGHNLIITGGMDYVVNIDAACFFSLEILPKLQKKYPDTTLKIVGSNPAPIILELVKNLGIQVTGRVPSMSEYLHQATVCIVPMRSGFGIKNKTLESMAAGVPVVASNRGLEGMEVDTAKVPLRALRANKIEEYVTAISRLFEDAKLRETLSQNARSLIEEEYTWDKLGNQYRKTIEETIKNQP